MKKLAALIVCLVAVAAYAAGVTFKLTTDAGPAKAVTGLTEDFLPSPRIAPCSTSALPTFAHAFTMIG